MKAFRVALTIAWVLLAPCFWSVAAEIAVKPVRFATGASSATAKASFADDKIVDYA